VFGALLERPPGEPSDELFRDPAYPYVHDDNEFRHPWDYPNPPQPKTELCPTTAGPHPTNAGPPALFRRSAQDPSIRDRLETAETPTDADRAGCDLTPTRHLGDAVSMTAYTIWLATREPGEGKDEDLPVMLTDWNLDADRGYGYHCWDWNRHQDTAQFKEVANPDLRQTKFRQPCTWPSQTRCTSCRISGR
jgi:hypothetical protein